MEKYDRNYNVYGKKIELPTITSSFKIKKACFIEKIPHKHIACEEIYNLIATFNQNELRSYGENNVFYLDIAYITYITKCQERNPIRSLAQIVNDIAINIQSVIENFDINVHLAVKIIKQNFQDF